jgi:hypothetical protein
MEQGDPGKARRSGHFQVEQDEKQVAGGIGDFHRAIKGRGFCDTRLRGDRLHRHDQRLTKQRMIVRHQYGAQCRRRRLQRRVPPQGRYGRSVAGPG